MDILIIEDNELDAKGMSDELHRRGFTPHVALNGNVALQMLMEFSPDVVLLDLILPDTTAGAMIGKIKNIRKSLPIIIVTAYGHKDNAIEYMRMGVKDFISKPINYDDLESSIREVLSEKKPEHLVRVQAPNWGVKPQGDAERGGQMDAGTLGRIEAHLEHLKEDVEAMKIAIKELNEGSRLEVFCGGCLARKIVYGMVAVMGVAIIGAILALVLRSPK